MKAPVTLLTFAALHGLTAVPITYHSFGIDSRGWDLINSRNAIQVSFEPCHYSNGDRWMVTDKTDSAFKSVRYLKSLRGAPSLLSGFAPAEWTGYSIN